MRESLVTFDARWARGTGKQGRRFYGVVITDEQSARESESGDRMNQIDTCSSGISRILPITGSQTRSNKSLIEKIIRQISDVLIYCCENMAAWRTLEIEKS
jgi:hypothetical protein